MYKIIIVNKGKNMRNQPKYSFFKNTKYALQGLLDLIKNEKSFRIELVLVCICIPVLFFIDTNLTNKVIMLITLLLIPLTEALNGAIERVVDLVTLEHHPMAGKAKDAGSATVFISITIFVITWGIFILEQFLK